MSGSGLPKIVAIVGPTAAGKTALGEALALRFNGEIVSADAKQVYRGMDIGTGKEKRLRVPQHLIDILNPGEPITVAQYQGMAYPVIDDILARGKLPLLTGGSMLYIEAVAKGYEFGGRGHRGGAPRYDVLYLGITHPRPVLHERIRQRFERWLDDGLVEEVRSLLDRGVAPAWLEACGMEYKYVTQYATGRISFEEMRAKTVPSIRQYAKRQETWWRHHGPVTWVEDEATAVAALEAFLR